MQTHARPLGPRSITRSVSPSPISLQDNSPLVIHKSQKSSSSLYPPGQSYSRSPAPSLGLSIPGALRPRPITPKPKLHIPISTPSNGSAMGWGNDDDPAEQQGTYYGGPNPPQQNSAINDPPDERTIRPEISTTVQRPTQREPIEDIRAMLNGLEIKTTTSPLPLPNPHPQHPADDDITTSWSDDVLEEISRLGEGAGGAVHKVKDKRTGRIMARKTITTREAPVKQLLRELSIMSSTEHINLIRFYGAYMSPSSSEVKIVMEFCEGGSLEAVGKRIKERGAVVGEKIVGRLAEGVLQGLAYLHTKKTIHRDIKPSNILLSREGIVKLCDFGVSGELVNSMAGTFTGTSFYMAPERICGKEYTIRSDVWSTGISLLELVQNRFPFPNDLPPIELMIYITTGEPPRLEDEPGVSWSDEMKDFIKQTLTVDAMTRPTPKDMLAHPWIISVMKQEGHMGRWIRQVWGWPRKSRDNTSHSRPNSGTSRPSSSHRDEHQHSHSHSQSPPRSDTPPKGEET